MHKLLIDFEMVYTTSILFFIIAVDFLLRVIIRLI
jgi:hypothetical protein